MNPVRPEYTEDNPENGQTFSGKDANFLLKLNRDNVGFTGEYKKVGDDEYSLETFIYQVPDFYNQTNIECDSKTFLQKNPNKVIELLYTFLQEF